MSSMRRESSEGSHQSVAERIVLVVLRVATLTSFGGGGGGTGAGWKDRLYVGVMYTINTIWAGFSTMFLFTSALRLAKLGDSIVHVASSSAFFGLQLALLWLALTWNCAGGRRRYGELLERVRYLLHRVSLLPEFEGAALKLRRCMNRLLGAVCGLAVFTCARSFYSALLDDMCRHSSGFGCSINVSLAAVYWEFSFTVFMIPLKFVFAGVQILSGFWTINSSLQPVADGRRAPSRALLRRLAFLHDELSRAFSQVTSCMAAELITLTAFGTLTQVCVWLLLITGAHRGDLERLGPVVAMYLVGAALTLTIPCEMAQRVLNAIGETRDLLLRSRWQRPELAQELSLFRDTVSRDLDTIGDLGLFRLQRSTTMAISATILTYVIVLVQFYLTEVTASSDCSKSSG